ncbi:glycogen debranching protein [Streptomyces sp. NBC_00009]|uniref:glycogen debranching protein n=1 Tax=Streptomyces sp. NBC_00009 TaxID=2975620 RepID=UPI00324B9EDC
MSVTTAHPAIGVTQPRISAGNAQPLGATVVPDGINFAVNSSTATGMQLVLMDAADGAIVAEIDFPDHLRVGTVFAMTVHGIDPARFHYGYRVATGDHLSPVILDPYAHELGGRGAWGERPSYRSAIPSDTFDWHGENRPHIAADDLVVYELHVRGYTRHASAAVAHPGTYAALTEKIPYLTALGVNCIELLPVFEFDESDNTYTSPDTGEPLRNFWGYNSVAFFAPKAGYAGDQQLGGAQKELKAMIKEFHRAGIEVILDVVFNHTAEGDHRGPTLSLRALDEQAYYLLTPDGAPKNLTRTGNTVNCNHPLTRAFILHCLRHWATAYHVDGFRFDMASILTRGTDAEILPNPPLVEAIANDPVLAHCKLIAEATDAAGTYQVGTFPHHNRWGEWNMRYRDAIRRFLLGRPGSAAEFATRLVGSPDLYAGRTAAPSINYITCHDGLTLADWTAYDQRHNEANGEGGLDGIPDEESWNCGAEGPTTDPTVQQLRERQARNALLLLSCSQGIPMLLGGDEFGRTQHGNNNTYSQDTPLGWVDWQRADTHADRLRFTKACLALRKRHPVLRRLEHPDSEPRAGWHYPQVSWHGTDVDEPDWSEDSTLLAALLYEQDPQKNTDCIYLAVNSGTAEQCLRLPKPPPGMHWRTFTDTGTGEFHQPGHEPVVPAGERRLAAHAALLLVAGPTS